jgi:hypothetical protein
MTFNKLVFTLTVFALAFSACSPSNLASIQPTINTISQINLAPSSTLLQPTQGAVATPTLSPVASSPASVGPNPENVPQGYNPLTGLPVADPSALELPAVLVSITNFPPSARPQAGLSFSPWVYEIYIAEGMTRYLAAFYGDFPKSITTNITGGAPQVPSAEVGPVRSGRLPYVYIRDAFQDSCLVYAGATEQLRAKLRGCAMVFGSDSTNINSAMLDVTRLQKIAKQNRRPADNFNYTGNLFTPQAQSQGVQANQIDIFYSYLNQAQWKFDAASGAYLKFDDFADGSGKFKPATDRLTGKQLAFSNVVVLYAQHTVLNPYIIDINLKAGEKGKAVIFRDGQKFDAFWSTMNGDYEKSTGLRRPLRLVDANGNPFPLKPGQTWVHVVTLPSLVQDKGAGQWKLRFYAPAGAK